MPRRNLRIVMENMVAKMECMWKPAQSGKTRTIQDIIRADDGVRNHLNVLICSNNRLLVAQTKVRMADDLYDTQSVALSVDEDGPADDHVAGGVYSWMSGTKKTNIPVEALAWKVVNGEVSMIVCCAHKARFRMLHDLLTKLEESPFFDKPVNVWIDEADVSVKHWSGDYDFSRFPCVRKMTLVSATFDTVFDHYKRIRVMPFPETHPACYVGLSNCDLQSFKPTGSGAASYMDEVLTAHPELITKGAKLFVPGDIERTTHDAIARYLTARGAIVLVLNGVEKAFRFPDGKVEKIAMRADEEHVGELSAILAAKYAEHHMERYPFAVTGQLCLGRGITFQSRDFTFDYAIIPSMKNSDAAYQCVARVLGNIADFSPWRPTVYMPDTLLDAVKRKERIAKNLARICHEKGLVEVSNVDDMMAEAAEEKHYELQPLGEFDTFAAAKLACVYYDYRPHEPKRNEAGFYMSSTSERRKHSYNEIVAFCNQGKKTAGLEVSELAVNQSVARMYACYKDGADAPTFIVRVVKRTR